MWFFNKQEDPPVVKLAKECRTCGHLIALGRGKKVDDSRMWDENPPFYCEGCAPPYDKVIQQSFTGKLWFFKTIPAHQVQVTEEGKPIEAKKTKKEGKKNGGN